MRTIAERLSELTDGKWLGKWLTHSIQSVSIFVYTLGIHGRGRGQEKKGTAEDEMAGWFHQLDGHEFEWTPGDGDRQGGLVYCDSWGRKESDTTEQLNWTDPDMCQHFQSSPLAAVKGLTLCKIIYIVSEEVVGTFYNNDTVFQQCFTTG